MIDPLHHFQLLHFLMVNRMFVRLHLHSDQKEFLLFASPIGESKVGKGVGGVEGHIPFVFASPLFDDDDDDGITTAIGFFFIDKFNGSLYSILFIIYNAYYSHKRPINCRFSYFGIHFVYCEIMRTHYVYWF